MLFKVGAAFDGNQRECRQKEVSKGVHHVASIRSQHSSSRPKRHTSVLDSYSSSNARSYPSLELCLRISPSTDN